MRPPAGVECAECREVKQHRCQAQMYDDGRPLCLPCANGDPCVIERVGLPPDPAAEEELFAVEAPPAPVVHRTAAELGLPQTAEMVPEPHKWSGDQRAERAEARRLMAAVQARRHGRELEREGAARARKRAERNPEAPVVRMIAGEPVAMSPHAVMGAEMIGTPRTAATANEERRTEMRAGGSTHSTKPISEEKKAQVLKLEAEGVLTLREIGEQVGVAPTTVKRVCAKAGAERRKPGPKPKPKSEVAVTLPKPEPVMEARRAEAVIAVEVRWSCTLERARKILASLPAQKVQIALQAVMSAGMIEG